MTLKNESLDLEKISQVQKLFIHEYLKGEVQYQLPVVTEHSVKYGYDGRSRIFEFYRARAFHGEGHSYKDFDPYANSVSVTICHKTKVVMFGPFGVIAMSPRGVGLGPALMANVIEWLQRQQEVLSYAIQPGMLSETDAKTDKDRVQRNKFYMAFGFVVSSVSGAMGEDVKDGSFTATSVGHLSIPERYQSMLKPWGMFDSKIGKERSTAADTAKLVSKARDWHKAGVFQREQWPL